MLKTILESDATWTLLGFAVNSLSSVFLASKLSKVGWVRRTIRVLHGFLDRVDDEK